MSIQGRSTDADQSLMLALTIYFSHLCVALVWQVESTVIEQLGTARKATISVNSTTLIADSASKDEIEMRVAQVRAQPPRSTPLLGNHI